MSYYRVKNITDSLPKRHVKANSIQTLKFKTLIEDKNINLSPGMEIVMEMSHLPVSAQILRTEGVITVVEISKNEYQTLLNDQNAREDQASALAEADNAKAAKIEEKKQKNIQKTK